MHSPKQPQWKAIKSILIYLKATPACGLDLTLSNNLNIPVLCAQTSGQIMMIEDPPSDPIFAWEVILFMVSDQVLKFNIKTL